MKKAIGNSKNFGFWIEDTKHEQKENSESASGNLKSKSARSQI